MLPQRNWRDLIKPQEARSRRQERSTPTYGKFVGEPFERGFGMTDRQLAAARAAVVAAGRGDHRRADRGRPARVLDAARASAKTSPTSCST